MSRLIVVCLARLADREANFNSYMRAGRRSIERLQVLIVKELAAHRAAGIESRLSPNSMRIQALRPIRVANRCEIRSADRCCHPLSAAKSKYFTETANSKRSLQTTVYVLKRYSLHSLKMAAC